MTRALTALLAALLVGACTTVPPTPQPSTAVAVDSTALMRHIVVFRYKPTATPEQIAEVTRAFAALRDRIPGIVDFEHGVNESPEGMNQGFTHVYQVTFTNAAARDAYLPHPEHRAFGELLGRTGILDSVFVVDYVPRR